jgi:dUTP pyrophosphatase
MRIAQAVLAPVTRGHFQLADTLPGSTRGEGGFGSTGHK